MTDRQTDILMTDPQTDILMTDPQIDILMTDTLLTDHLVETLVKDRQIDILEVDRGLDQGLEAEVAFLEEETEVEELGRKVLWVTLVAKIQDQEREMNGMKRNQEAVLRNFLQNPKEML